MTEYIVQKIPTTRWCSLEISTAGILYHDSKFFLGTVLFLILKLRKVFDVPHLLTGTLFPAAVVDPTTPYLRTT